jgi:hypothetical protein
VHPRFDISRLKPFYERSMWWIPPGGDTTQAWSPEMDRWHPPYTLPHWLHQPEEQLPPVPDEHEYEVKTILSHRTNRDGVRYLVSWHGYQPEESSWVHADDCKNAPQKIQEYHDRLLRMQTYHALGDSPEMDYMQLAALRHPRTDDYLYQFGKSTDFLHHCGTTLYRLDCS